MKIEINEEQAKKTKVIINGKEIPLEKLPCWKCEWRYSIHCPKCEWNKDGKYNVYGE